MIEQDFYVEIKQILNSAREKVYKTANLANMRQCYLTFSNFYALRSELSWTHYRMLMRVNNKNARQFYLEEAVKSNWSTRQLERQINSFFYERLLSSKNKDEVSKEIVKVQRILSEIRMYWNFCE